ncbi:MAG: galactose mutarotase [Rhodobacteraceae bacterium]|nr:galactose mutarotase [Paracoccaceae bacterium]
MTSIPSSSDVSYLGEAPDGEPVRYARLSNGGVTAAIMTWGASLQELRFEGLPYSLALGSEAFDAYLSGMKYFGAIVGPVANRIKAGRFMLDGRIYDLERNEDARTTLHGGTGGFGERNWRLLEANATSCWLSLEHADGTCGFPGNISVTAVYKLTDDGVLRVKIQGRSDRRTMFNPAFHGYWNLSGAPTLADHTLTIPAETYLPVDDHLIPVGAPAPVMGTAFDYRRGRAPDPELDHNFCLISERGQIRPVCRLECPSAALEVRSTEPGLQVYTGGGLATAPWAGHGGAPYGPLAGIALEPQVWPDAPNNPDYPSALLEAGEKYQQVTEFAFQRL